MATIQQSPAYWFYYLSRRRRRRRRSLAGILTADNDEETIDSTERTIDEDRPI